MVACMVRVHEAVGSTPATPTKIQGQPLAVPVFFCIVKPLAGPVVQKSLLAMKKK